MFCCYKILFVKDLSQFVLWKLVTVFLEVYCVEFLAVAGISAVSIVSFCGYICGSNRPWTEKKSLKFHKLDKVN